MKKLLIFLTVISFVVIIPGCFGGADEKKEEKPQEAETNSYQGEQFSLSPPKDWDTITTFTKEYPVGTVIAFRNNIKDEMFTANINIFTKSILHDFTPIDLALEELKNHETNLINYKEISRENTKITISGKALDTLLIYFEGKQSHEEEIVRFMQIFAAKDGVGYIVTFAAKQDESEEIVKEGEKTIRSFVVK